MLIVKRYLKSRSYSFNSSKLYNSNKRLCNSSNRRSNNNNSPCSISSKGSVVIRSRVGSNRVRLEVVGLGSRRIVCSVGCGFV